MLVFLLLTSWSSFHTNDLNLKWAVVLSLFSSIMMVPVSSFVEFFGHLKIEQDFALLNLTKSGFRFPSSSH